MKFTSEADCNLASKMAPKLEARKVSIKKQIDGLMEANQFDTRKEIWDFMVLVAELKNLNSKIIANNSVPTLMGGQRKQIELMDQNYIDTVLDFQEPLIKRMKTLA